MLGAQQTSCDSQCGRDDGISGIADAIEYYRSTSDQSVSNLSRFHVLPSQRPPSGRGASPLLC